MKTAFLFPGQGSQEIDLFNHLPNEPIIKKTINEASEILNEDIKLLQTKEALKSTRNVQISLFVSGISVYRHFQNKRYIPSFVAGHSVGAFAAAVVSEVLSYEDGLNLVSLRGKMMEEIHPSGYGMIVVLGMDQHQLKKILNYYFTDEHPLYLANINSPTQITVSGSREGLEKVINYVKNNGANCASFLPVTTPSHSPLLQPVANELKAKMKGITTKSPSINYVANYHARILYNSEDILEDLYKSVAAPVQWDNVTSILYESNVRYFQEFPPGNVLTKLLLNKFSDIRALSLSTAGLSDCLYILDKIQDKE